MYHLKENKLIILNSFLSLNYETKIAENVNLYYEAESQKYKISKSTSLNLVIHWIYNGITLDTAKISRIKQTIEYPEFEELKELFSRVKELKIDIEKVESVLTILNHPDNFSESELESNRDKINKLLAGINLYFLTHPDTELQNQFLMDSAIQSEIYNKLYNICREVKVEVE